MQLSRRASSIISQLHCSFTAWNSILINVKIEVWDVHIIALWYVYRLTLILSLKLQVTTVLPSCLASCRTHILWYKTLTPCMAKYYTPSVDLQMFVFALRSKLNCVIIWWDFQLITLNEHVYDKHPAHGAVTLTCTCVTLFFIRILLFQPRLFCWF